MRVGEGQFERFPCSKTFDGNNNKIQRGAPAGDELMRGGAGTDEESAPSAHADETSPFSHASKKLRR